MTEKILARLRDVFTDYDPDDASANVVVPSQKLLIYLLNEASPVDLVEEHFVKNTRNGWYTLVLVDQEVLPLTGERLSYDPDNAWILALHAVFYGRIYTYVGDEIIPLHLDYDQETGERVAAYGPDIREFRLEFSLIDCQSTFMEGRFAHCMLGDRVFWKASKWKQRYTYTHRSAPPKHKSTRASTCPPQFVVLGIDPRTPYEAARKAYRQKALELHPDRHPENPAIYTARMQEINAAWEYVRSWNGWKS